MADAEPRTVAVFDSTADTGELSAALAAALDERGITTTAPVTIEHATELSVELGGRLVSLLIGAPVGRPVERFLSIGRIVFPTGRLIGQRDETQRQQLADLLDEVLRDVVGISEPEWMTPTAWKERPAG